MQIPSPHTGEDKKRRFLKVLEKEAGLGQNPLERIYFNLSLNTI
jgi:hypothetical protein